MTGLEALNKIDNEVLYGVYAQEHYSNELATIRKSLKALEIIKEKKVNIELLNASSSVEDYNNEVIRNYGYAFSTNRILTQEEFNLLKEMLE